MTCHHISFKIQDPKPAICNTCSEVRWTNLDCIACSAGYISYGIGYQWAEEWEEPEPASAAACDFELKQTKVNVEVKRLLKAAKHNKPLQMQSIVRRLCRSIIEHDETWLDSYAFGFYRIEYLDALVFERLRTGILNAKVDAEHKKRALTLLSYAINHVVHGPVEWRESWFLV